MENMQINQTHLDWLNLPVAALDYAAQDNAIMRQAMLTKPPGALGRLEEVTIRLAAMQGNEHPDIERIQIVVFAGDHGVATEGVSAFPQSVTAEMVKNFARGGAAICVAANALAADLKVINLGTAFTTGAVAGVQHFILGPGTRNFIHEPAMSEHQITDALYIGRQAAEQAQQKGMQLFIGGEMGIGNTTVATALACALLDVPPQQLAGAGSGLDKNGIARKIDIIHQALKRHSHSFDTPLEVLRCLGGFEIAALTGSYITCAQIGIPVLVDGFISTVAALTATRLCTGAGEWFLYSHTSAETGHPIVLAALAAKPLLDLGMRLGEGSGAAITVPLLRMACALHNEMATFAEAGVCKKNS